MASKKIQTDKINALKVKNLLRKKYPMPEYEIFFEVCYQKCRKTYILDQFALAPAKW